MATLDNLQAGQSVVYYRGSNLARARQCAPVEAADAAWESAMRGEVFLVQRKLDSGGYAYVAIGRRRLDKNPVRAMITVAYKPRKAA